MGDAIADVPVKARTAKASALLSLKRTFDLFSGNYNFGQRTSADTDSQKLKLACKVPDKKALLASLPQLHLKKMCKQIIITATTGFLYLLEYS